jgi:hypothetical protein
VGKCRGRTRQKLKERREIFIYSFNLLNPHSKSPLSEMFFVDPATTSIAFVPDASTIFVLVFAALLVIVWCALALWVYSVIRSSSHHEPEDVELAFRGRSPPQPPLPPTPSTLPLSPSRPPPAYLSRSRPRSWGNLFINRPLRRRDDRIPSRPLQSPHYYVAPFTGEIVRD